MRTLVGLQFKAFARRTPLAGIAVLFVVAVALLGGYEVFLWVHYGYRGLDALSFSTRYLIFWPLTLAVLGYEFMSRPAREGMDESVRVLGAASARHWLAMSVVPASLLAGAFGLYLALRFVVLAASSTTWVLWANVLEAAALDVLAPSLIALLFGLLLARRTTRFGAYASIAAFVFVIGPYFEVLPFTLQYATMQSEHIINLYPMTDLFRVLAPDPTWEVDLVYGFPVEYKRWVIAGFWVCLLATLDSSAAAAYGTRLSARWRAVGFLAAALLVGLFFVPSSELRKDFRPNGATYGDAIYYEILAKQHPPRERAADFSVGRYDLSLVAGSELSAVAKLGVSHDAHRGVYEFTLYHGFRVGRVLGEDGAPLRFEQSGDYLSVLSARRQRTLTVEYRGDSPSEIVNFQGVFLPGYFPYFPVPGDRLVWDRRSHALATDVTGRAPAFFSVTIAGGVPVSSNLRSTSDRLVGVTRAPTIVGGLIDRRTADGRAVTVFPASGERAERLEPLLSSLKALERRLGATGSPVPDHRAWFQLPDMAKANTPVVVLPDAVLLTGFDPSFAPEILLAGRPEKWDRSTLRQALLHYLGDPADFTAHAAALKTPEPAEIADLERMRVSASPPVDLQPRLDAAVDRLFYELVRGQGAGTALKQTYRFLVSSDSTSDLLFLSQAVRGVGDDRSN